MIRFSKPGFTAVGLLALVMCVSQAVADPKVDARKLDCKSLQQAIQKNGSAIVHYNKPGASMPLYARYVANTRQCQSGSSAVFARVPTADGKSCPVKKCEQVY
jgi:hypothetical protein